MTPVPTPDPIGDPSGYQRHLLSLLGDDDPAEVQAATPTAWRSIIERAGDLMALRPEPGEWSALECLGHATDAEIVYAGRYRWIVAHEDPPLIGYDQDRWVERLHKDPEDPDDLVRLFETLRRANLELWARATSAEKARIGLHAERGPESLDLSFRLIAGHDRFHLDQARRGLAAIEGRSER
jgi:DinB superfamily